MRGCGCSGSISTMGAADMAGALVARPRDAATVRTDVTARSRRRVPGEAHVQLAPLPRQRRVAARVGLRVDGPRVEEVVDAGAELETASEQVAPAREQVRARARRQ